ncbi:MAG: HAD family hydrolase [Motiliproteus sp.]|nr:HAD family hydrolase [Motiliproteus sp.]MCW9051172.1 HAD family hydrolase [Motiliproteus sp.]
MTIDLQQCHHWIFYLDGTLTQPLHDFVAIRRELGVPTEEGILEYIARQPMPLRQQLNHRLTAIERRIARRAVANPGAVMLLQTLAEQGCRLGILTRNQRDCVDIVLNRIGVESYFEAQAIIACEDAPPKPDPVGINQIIQYWQVSPRQCVMVGDFRYDLEVGRAAGIPTVHFAADRQERWPDLTDLVVENLAQLQVFRV